MPGKWTYRPDSAEWIRHYSADTYAVVYLERGIWRGRLIVGSSRRTDGQWRDSKTAKRELDKAQREHAARMTT